MRNKKITFKLAKVKQYWKKTERESGGNEEETQKKMKEQNKWEREYFKLDRKLLYFLNLSILMLLC